MIVRIYVNFFWRPNHQLPLSSHHSVLLSVGAILPLSDVDPSTLKGIGKALLDRRSTLALIVAQLTFLFGRSSP